MSAEITGNVEGILGVFSEHGILALFLFVVLVGGAFVVLKITKSHESNITQLVENNKSIAKDFKDTVNSIDERNVKDRQDMQRQLSDERKDSRVFIATMMDKLK